MFITSEFSHLVFIFCHLVCRPVRSSSPRDIRLSQKPKGLQTTSLSLQVFVSSSRAFLCEFSLAVLPPGIFIEHSVLQAYTRRRVLVNGISPCVRLRRQQCRIDVLFGVFPLRLSRSMTEDSALASGTWMRTSGWLFRSFYTPNSSFENFDSCTFSPLRSPFTHGLLAADPGRYPEKKSRMKQDCVSGND